MISTEKVAILMATYNGERYISEQLDSLLSQTYTNWELFVHDDGSNDKTLDIISDYAEKYSEKVTIITGPTTGCAKNNFFLLMRNVSAPYIMCCDQDDVWCNDKIEKTMKCMKHTEQTVGKNKPILIFSDLTVVDQDLRVKARSMNKIQKLNPQKIKFKDVLIQNNVTGCTIMINRSCAQKALEVKDQNSVIMHDWWCALVAAKFGTITYIDESLILYRQHGDNSVGAKNVGKISYIVERLNRNNEIKKSLDDTRKQAMVFSDTYSIGKDEVSSQYAVLSEKNKLKRLFFYIDKSMWKQGLARNIGLIIWG